MTRELLPCGVLCVTVLAATVCAQTAPRFDGPVTFRTLSAEVPQTAAFDTVREIRVRWTATTSSATSTSAAATAHAFAIVEQRSTRGALKRDRRPELSGDQIVVVLQSADGRALDWRLTRNPRIVRAEAPGPGGTLSGTTIERDTELFVAVPDLPDASSLRIYQPRWTGSDYLLEIVGDIPLGASR